jgi:hypothetical protein
MSNGLIVDHHRATTFLALAIKPEVSVAITSNSRRTAMIFTVRLSTVSTFSINEVTLRVSRSCDIDSAHVNIQVIAKESP